MKMNLRRAIIPFAVASITVFLVVLSGNDPPARTEPQAPAEEAGKPIRPAAGAVAVLPPDPAILQRVPSHPMAVSFGESPDLATAEPAILLEILQFYRQEFGTFPAGEDNAAIMNVLRGNNPSGLPIFPAKHPRIAEDGSLLDAWGKPFFFHIIGSQHIEVRSLGPDGEIFTEDDIVVPKRPAR